MKIAGEQTVDGRKLLALESVAGKWKSSDPGSRATALVDAETFAVKQIASILDGGLFNQTVDNRLTETLDAGKASSAKLGDGQARYGQGDPQGTLSANAPSAGPWRADPQRPGALPVAHRDLPRND